MTNNFESSEELYRKSQTNFLENKYKDAIENINSAITMNSNVQKYIYLRASIYFAIGEYWKAITDLNNSIRLENNNIKSLKLRALAYGMTNEKNQALNDWNQVIENGGNNVENYLQRAVTEAQLSRYDLAIADCERGERDLIYGDMATRLKVTLLRNIIRPEYGSNFEKASKVLFKGEGESTNDKKLIAQMIEFLCACYDFLATSKSAGQEAMGDVLYQYTGPMTLPKICSLSESENKKTEFKLRLYDTTYMNDPDEGSVFIDKIEYDGLKKNENILINDQHLNVYIASLTKISPVDSAKGMPLWNSYGKGHTGIALGVKVQQVLSNNQSIMKDISSSVEIHSNLYKVFYDGDQQVQDDINIMRDNSIKIREEIRNNEIARSVYTIMNRALQKVRFLYKKKFYSYEEEYRVIKESSLKETHFDYNDPKLFVFVNKNDLNVQLTSITFGVKFENPYLWVPVIKRNLGYEITCNRSMISYR